MGGRRWWLVGISALLTVHGFAAGLMLPSSFFIVAFCWLWTCAAALLDRPDDAKAMSATMIVLLLAAAVFVKFTPLGRHDLAGFYYLALLPSLVAWISIYALIRHIQYDASKPEQVMSDWFTEQAAQSPVEARVTSSVQFVRSLLGGVAHDNHLPAGAAESHGADERRRIA